MKSPAPEAARCTVSGAELLPAASGGADLLCETVRRALSAGGGQAASVEVRVLSPHLLAATTTLSDGRRMPEVKTARTDRPLGQRSFQMLADALAAQLARVRD